MHIYIVIPVHNRRELTRGCLESLRAQTYPDFTVIVVDDGSNDGTGDMIRDEFPEVVLLSGDGNLWWTGAINEGIRYALDVCAPQDAILALNDDLLLPEDYLETMAGLAGRNPNTLIGSVVTDVNNREIVFNGGIHVNQFTAAWRGLNEGVPLASFPKGHLEDATTLTGRGTLIPSEAFRRLGLYDRKHFKQCGDLEFPMRARDAGYRLAVSYDAPVWSYTSDGNPRNVNTTPAYRLSDLRRYFFDVKSNMNLVTRFWFAWTTRRNVVQACIYYALDVARITVHFIRGLRVRNAGR